MDATKKDNLKKRALEEMHKFVVFAVYVWFVLTLLEVHKLAVLRALDIDSELGFKIGLNLVNAAVFGKVVLLGDSLHFGERFQDKALIFRVLFKSAVFAVLLLSFEMGEEIAVGMLHGKTLAESVPEFGGGGWEGTSLVGAMLFACLIPLFTLMGIRRALGESAFHSLIFGSDPKARSAKR